MIGNSTITFHSFLKSQKDFGHRFTQMNTDDKTKKEEQNKRVSIPIIMFVFTRT